MIGDDALSRSARGATEHLNIEQSLAVLRRRWPVILLVVTLVTGATLALSEHQQRMYTAVTSIVFEDSQLNQQASGLQVTNNSVASDPQIMATDVQLLTQQSGTAAATARVIGHGLTASQVATDVSAAQQGSTDVANLSATSTTPHLAARIANTYAAEFIASQQAQQRAQVGPALQLVERQIGAMSPQQLAGPTGQALIDRAESLRVLGSLQNGGAHVITLAAPPGSPSSPKILRDTILGLLLGILLGVTLAFLLERFDRRIKTPAELEAVYQLPLLAAIPRSNAFSQAPRPGLNQPHEAEVFKLLRAYLGYFSVDREMRSLVVASAAPGDGKSVVSRNLAQAAQETGTKTLLVEADLRRPGAATHYGVAARPGLSELLIGRAKIDEVIRSVPIMTRVNGSVHDVTVDVLVAGATPPNAAELVASNAMADVLSWAAEHYELVIIDTPPLAVVADAVPLLGKVDGVVLVSRIGASSRDVTAFVRDRLLASRAPLLGVVANRVQAKGAAGYGYGYGYGHYGAGGEGAEGRSDQPAEARSRSNG